MNWKITDNGPDKVIGKYYDGRVSFEFIPLNEPLIYFFSGIALSKCPYFLEEIIKRRQYSTIGGSVRFYEDLDHEDFMDNNVFKVDEVAVYHELAFSNGFLGQSIISLKTFFIFIFEYCSEIASIHQGNPTLSENWHREMMIGLAKLGEEIKKLD